jgi:hypothetical protein
MNPELFDPSRFKSLLPPPKITADSSPAWCPPHFALPSTLQILLVQAETVLNSLVILKRRRQGSPLSSLREIVEAQTQHSFTEHTLRQVLTILPRGAIATEWRQDHRRTLPHQLYVALSSSDSIEQLLGNAAAFLIEWVEKCHADFLRSIGQTVSEVYKCHIGFDLESVPPIPPEFLPRPEIEFQPTIHQAFSQPLPSRVPPSCANLESYLSVVKRVQEKALLKSQDGDDEERQHRADLLKLADSLNALFCIRKKTSIPLPDVVGHLQKTEHFLRRERRRLEALLRELAEKSDGYFRWAQLRGVTYLMTEPAPARSYQAARGPIVRNVSGDG